MSDFFEAILSPDVPVIRYALIAGLLSSVALGIIGTYVITRRISYIAGAISHSVLGGIGAALYLQVVWHCRWCDPMYGAVVAALASAGLIGGVSLQAKQREDTVIGAIWSVGMAIGLLFFAKTPGYVDPMSYLFGNILLLTRGDLICVFVLDALVIVLVSHDLGFVTNLVERVICVNRQAVAHPASQLTADLIRDMYGGDVHIVRHGDVMCHREHVHE